MKHRVLLQARRGYHVGKLHTAEAAAAKAQAQLAHATAQVKGEHREIHRYDVALAATQPSHPFTMYDSVDVSVIPANAKAVAGYVGGHWPTFFTLQKQFPTAKKLSIAVNAGEDAHCLDVETGDAVPSQAPAWVKRQHERGIRRPVVYASTSVVPQVHAALANAGVQRKDYMIWSAHYTGTPHIEPGSDATQWTSAALGRNLDASLCQPWFIA